MMVRGMLLSAAALNALAISTPAGAQGTPGGAATAAGAASETRIPAETGQAQGALGEIVVTANREVTDLQTTPAVVNVVGGEKLDALRVTDVSQITQVVPGLKLDGNVNFQSRLGLRGAITTGDKPSLSQSVGLYIDGIFIGRSVGLLAALDDVQRVEVLRGPQGTLFGRNVVGGAVSVITKDPGDELEGRVGFGIGRFDAREVSGQVSGPLFGGLRAAIGASLRERDGWQRNLVTGNLLDERRDTSVRGKLTYDLEFAKFKLFGLYSTNRQIGIPRNVIATTIDNPGACATGPSTFVRTQLRAAGYTNAQINAQVATICAAPLTGDPVRFTPILASENKFVTRKALDGRTDGNTFVGGFDQTYNLSDAANVQSITGYSIIHANSQDYDFYVDPVLYLAQDFRIRNTTFQQEVRAFGKLPLFGADNGFQYQFGVFYWRDKIRTDNLARQINAINAPQDVFGVAFGTSRPGPYEAPFLPGNLVNPLQNTRNGVPQKRWNNYENITTDSLASYVQLTVRPLEWLGLTGGARLTRDKLTGIGGVAGDALDSGNLSTPPCYFYGSASDPAILQRLATLDAQSTVVNNISVNQCQFAPPIKRTFRKATYKATADATFRGVGPFDTLLLYGTFSTGFKSGSINFRSSLTDVSILEPEQATNYEAGFKTTFLNGRLAINSTAFQVNYKNLQTLSIPAGESSSAGQIVRGVSVNGKAKGIETQVSIYPLDGLSLDFFHSYLKARINPNQTVPNFSGAPVAIGGNRLPQAPTTSLSIGGTYKTDIDGFGGVRFTANYDYESYVCYTVENSTCVYQALRDASVQKNLNASVGFTRGGFDLNIFVRNILDTAAAQRILAGPTSQQYHPFEAFGLRKSLWGGLVQEPRTWGVRLQYNFGARNDS